MSKSTRGGAAVIILACAGMALGHSAAGAEPACTSPLTASGRAAYPLNYDPPKHYNAEKLAKDRAIAKWRELVASKCPQSSNLWWRARDRKVDCEGYAGGTGCEATGIPSKRIRW